MHDQNIFMQLTENKERSALIDSQPKFVNYVLEEVFKFTVNPNCGKNYKLLKYVTGELLTRDNLYDALMETLGVYDDKSYNRLDYLNQAYKRCAHDYLRTKEINKEYQDPTILTEIKEAIISNAITYALAPEFFRQSKSGVEIFELINENYGNNISGSFLTEIRKRLKDDELSSFFEPALFVVINRLNLYTQHITDVIYSESVNIFNYFTSDENITKVLVFSNAFAPINPPTAKLPALNSNVMGLPIFNSPVNSLRTTNPTANSPTTTVGVPPSNSPANLLNGLPNFNLPLINSPPIDFNETFVNKTILGLIFNAVCTHARHREPIYFNLRRMSHRETFDQISTLRMSINAIINQLIPCLKRLFAHAQFKHSVYYWFYSCLRAHEYRRRIGQPAPSESTSFTHDGFFANMCMAILKIAEPIINDLPKFISRVYVDFCRYKHVYKDLAGREFALNFMETSMVRTGVDKNEYLDEKSFNFQTHFFFLAHEVLRIGYIPSLEIYLNITKEIQSYNEEIANRAVTEEEYFSDEQINMITNEQFCLKTQILNPDIIFMAFNFISASCVWLLNALGIDVKLTFNIKFTNYSPDIYFLYFIPESLLEQLASFVILVLTIDHTFLNHFLPQLPAIFNCFAIFMGRKDFVTNPHLRAKLCEAINYLIFFDLDDSSLQPNIELIFEESDLLAHVLPYSLLNLFVDIEFTGHTNEFQQKFQYRFYMYKILFFIWRIPKYIDTFKMISSETTLETQETLPLFLRFINLLINDATFLLDESLGNLVKIKEIEYEITTQEFKELDENAKKEKIKNMKMLRKQTKSLNLLANDTLETVRLLTETTPDHFISLTIVDRIAAMLNYFLRQLVGEKKQDLKVQKMDNLHFEPKKLVVLICQIFSNLSKDDGFCRSVVCDERSFTLDLPDMAINILNIINIDFRIIDDFVRFKNRLMVIYKTKDAMEIDPEDIPDEFLDPISYTLIRDPVMLPSSKQIVDRTTITKHLLSDETDPFSRAKLTVSMLIPQPDLKSRIDNWLLDRNK